MKIRFVLVVLLQLALMTLWALNAQDMNDNFFYIEEETYRDATVNTQAQGIWGNMTVTDYEDGTILPLGDGLWLLAAAAGLYLIIRTRKSRKTATMIAAALALTLGMTQCRKPQPNEPVTPTGETIFISLTGGNGGGAKTDVNVDNGKITWNDTDKVYVVYNGKLLGTTGLSVAPNSGDARIATISGAITTSVSIGDDPYFTFYYVGNDVGFTKTDGAGSLSFDISSQNGSDAGDCMIGRTQSIRMRVDGSNYEPYEEPTWPKTFTPLTATLLLSTQTSFGVGLMTMIGTNMGNTMTIDLSNPTSLSYSNKSGITFQSGNNVQISVMPTTPEGIDANELLSFGCNGKRGVVMIANGIKSGRVYVKIVDGTSQPIPVVAAPDGAVPGVFSVGDSQKVYFANGNLQYLGKNSAGSRWRFAEHQYDFMGSGPGSGTTNGNVTLSGYAASEYNSNGETNARDYFGWGCTGTQDSRDHTNQRYYQPYSLPNTDIVSETYNKFGYGPDMPYSLDPNSGSDWGGISELVGNSPSVKVWRTFTLGELIFLFRDRTTSTVNGKNNARYAPVRVNGTNGHFLFPDLFVWPSDAGSAPAYNHINGGSGTYNDANAYSLEQFALLEKFGVVFLPAAGIRINVACYDVKTCCRYWTSSVIDAADASDLNAQAGAAGYESSRGNRYGGFCVRLVRNAPTNAAINENYGEAVGDIPW